MANIVPSLPHPSLRHGGLKAELDVLRTLGQRLPEAYTVFHAVDWAKVGKQGRLLHAEIDIIVVNQAGDLLLIEVKSGRLSEQGGRLSKRYDDHDRDVTQQMGMQFGVVRSRLKHAGLSQVQIEQLLLLPDHKLKRDSAQWPRERIVDSTGYPVLPARVQEVLHVGIPNPEQYDAVCALLRQELDVAPDVSALAGRADDTITRLSAGLATWVPRISAPSGLIRVQGSAGSGKTQLALRMLNDANQQERKAAYFCFNRALADHMGRLCPARCEALTFHEYALRLARNAGSTVDFSRPHVFDELAERAAGLIAKLEPDLDLLVIDEMQDFQPDWVAALCGRLLESGRALFLEDANQCLYRNRAPFDLPDAVLVRSMDDFRSPTRIVELINVLKLTDEPVVAAGAWPGEPPDPIESIEGDTQDCLRQTAAAVQRCLDRGFALSDIAVISLKGRDRSAVCGAERLGPWSTRRFSGRFDAGGQPQWIGGELLVDTVRRFKGQSAPAIVLTECDFDALDEQHRRLLFVGLTRAKLHVEWVLSERAARAVRSQLEAASGS